MAHIDFLHNAIRYSNGV